MVPALAALLLAGCDYLRPFEQVCEQRLGPASVRVAAVIRAAMRGAQQRQADLDSPEEYGRLDLMQSKCTG